MSDRRIGLSLDHVNTHKHAVAGGVYGWGGGSARERNNSGDGLDLADHMAMRDLANDLGMSGRRNPDNLNQVIYSLPP